MKKITVVGAGGTGHTIAADLAQRGFDVRLCDSERYREVLDRTAANGGVRTSGQMGDGFVALPVVTTDVAAALKDADLVITDGSPFEVSTTVRRVLIGGKTVHAV